MRLHTDKHMANAQNIESTYWSWTNLKKNQSLLEDGILYSINYACTFSKQASTFKNKNGYYSQVSKHGA